MKEIVIIVLLTQISSFMMFCMGLYCSNNFSRRSSKIKTINPIEIIKDNIKEKKEVEQEELKRKQTSVLLENINNYSGSSLGQKQIPRN